MNRTTVMSFVLLLTIIVCAQADARTYRIGVDDVLNITVYREADLSLVVRVEADGRITYPLLGSIKAAGLTVPELEKVITNGLKKYIHDPHVTVFIAQYGTITVNGEVNKPGIYPLKSELTALEAISLAGGFTDFAARGSVKITRIENGVEKVAVVNAQKMNEKGDRSKDVILKHGDIIFVTNSTITVSGEVNKPDIYPLKNDLTVLEAISLAGGFTDFAARNAVKVIRHENGEDKTIVVQVERISKKGDRSKDVQLKNRDIVFVPESLF